MELDKLNLKLKLILGELELSLLQMLDLLPEQTFAFSFSTPFSLCADEEEVAKVVFVKDKEQLFLKIVEINEKYKKCEEIATGSAKADPSQ